VIKEKEVNPFFANGKSPEENASGKNSGDKPVKGETSASTQITAEYIKKNNLEALWKYYMSGGDISGIKEKVLNANAKN